MAFKDDLIGTDIAEAGRRFAGEFDRDRVSAVSQFRRILSQKGPAEKLLQRLNALGRHDIVIAATGEIAFDAQISGTVAVERARALARTGDGALALGLLDGLAATYARDYLFQYSAGRVLAEAQMPGAALGFFEAAVRAKPTTEAAERLFLVYLRLGRYQEAAAAMGRIIRVGTYDGELADDFAYLLESIAPGELDPDLAFALAALPSEGADDLAAALLPHLVALDQLDSVLSVAARLIADSSTWNEKILASLVPYLGRHGQLDTLLQVQQSLYGAQTPARKLLAEFLSQIPAEHVAKAVTPDIAGFVDPSASGIESRYVALAGAYFRSADPKIALEMISLLPALIAPDRAGDFYIREKKKLGQISLRVVQALGETAEVTDALAALVVHVMPAHVRVALRSPVQHALASAIAVARRMAAAPAASKLGRLRDGYFAYYLARRMFLDVDALESDLELCKLAVDYFRNVAAVRLAVATPVDAALARRLSQPAFSAGGGRRLDILTSFAMMEDRRDTGVTDVARRGEFCWWYLTRIAGARKVPPSCLAPEIVADLNEPFEDALAIPATRFLKLFWRHAHQDRKSVTLANIFDRAILAVNLIATELPQSESYLSVLEPYLAEGGLVDRVLGISGGAASGLPAAVRGAGMTCAPRSRDGALQDILVIGHAAKGTGLGRNYRMLIDGLTSDRTAVTGLDFDLHAETFNDQLARWYEACGSDPIVVFAVNAQDVPDAFAKDNRGILSECHGIGFFLWEASRPPAVQKLGIELVDEIWAPTSYVAEIYSDLAPTHVVGKGLFRGDEEYLSLPRAATRNPAFTFVTVFDFDSSVERKNPLATVLAFQDAFRVDENVALVVKTSNVNAMHWSNASRQWERLIAAAAGDPRITIVTERYSGEQMTALIRDADCVVSLHRSEGFGYLISDAMAFGTPVVATDYSGNADFMSNDTAFPVSCKLVPLPPRAMRWDCEGAVWADADVASAAAQMRSVFDDYEAALAKAQRARERIRTKYSADTFRAALLARVDAIRTARRRTG